MVGTDNDGNPTLQLVGHGGVTRVQIAVNNLDEASLILMDKAGGNVLLAEVGGEGDGSVQISDTTGTPRAVMHVSKDGTASIELHETRHKSKVLIRLNGDDSYEGSFERKPETFE
jgi:hypothetical protein